MPEGAGGLSYLSIPPIVSGGLCAYVPSEGIVSSSPQTRTTLEAASEGEDIEKKGDRIEEEHDGEGEDHEDQEEGEEDDVAHDVAGVRGHGEPGYPHVEPDEHTGPHVIFSAGGLADRKMNA